MSIALADHKQKRRSRMRRKSSGRRVELSSRDIEIFKLLQRYRYLRSTFLHAFVGGRQETRFKERLGQLYHDGRYLDRPKEQWSFANARYAPVIYELGERGRNILRELGTPGTSAAMLAERSRPGINRQFAHALMICEALASIELGARASKNVRFIPWPEILAKIPDSSQASVNPTKLPVTITHQFRTGKAESVSFGLIPDAIFGLEYRLPDGSRRYRFFALEAERANRVTTSSLQPSSFVKKVLAYREIVARQTHQQHLGLPNLIVLTVTNSAAKVETMHAAVMELTASKGSAMFLFQTIPTLGQPLAPASPMPELFTAPWQRAGYPSLSIDRP